MSSGTDTKKLLTIVVCLLLLAASITWIYLQNRSKVDDTKNASKPLESLGVVLAQETVKLVNGRGKVLLITVANRVPAAKPQPEVSGFEKELKKTAGITLVKEQVAQDGIEIPADQFVKMLGRNRSADVVVSLVGCPVIKEGNLASLGEKTPKFICVAWSNAGIRGMLQQKLVELAVLARVTPAPNKTPVTARDWFDNYFEIYTSANCASLPE